MSQWIKWCSTAYLNSTCSTLSWGSLKRLICFWFCTSNWRYPSQSIWHRIWVSDLITWGGKCMIKSISDRVTFLGRRYSVWHDDREGSNIALLFPQIWSVYIVADLLFVYLSNLERENDRSSWNCQWLLGVRKVQNNF
jgi:hypothetical protein